MATKFLGFRVDPLRPFDFSNKKKWRKLPGGKGYKLLNPDPIKDKQYAFAYVKAAKAFDAEQRMPIAGVANANIVDRMDERLDPRGIELEHFMKNPQLLAHHSYFHPVGQVESLDIQEDGIHFSGWVGDPSKAELTEMQKEMRSLIAQGIIKTVSVGFIPKKIRAPLYNEAGDLEEALVIEQWELLEISLVSVPCNQDSIVEMRDIAKPMESAKIDSEASKDKSLNDSGIESKISELVEQNTVVQTLIFDKAMFSKQEAIDWAKGHDFRADKVDETEDSYRLRQREPSEFDEESFRTIDITDGVKAVIGKLKEGTEMVGKTKEVEDNKESNYQEEMLTLMKGMNALLQRNTEMTELMLKKLEEKPMDKPVDECPPKEDEAAKAMEARVEKMEKSFAKLAESVNLIVSKLSK